MEYRVVGRNGDRLSEISVGTSTIGEKDPAIIRATAERAIDAGVNFIDLAAGHGTVFGPFGEAIRGCRDDIRIQIPFGADYSKNVYGWAPSIEDVKRTVPWMLEKLGTDRIDYGCIHCIDEPADLEKYMETGVLDYILRLQDQGIVDHVSLSTHSVEIANKVLDMGVIDVMMFPVNPMYDYGEGEWCRGTPSERAEVYGRCMREGVGIVVMKAFSGGILLDPARSPFGTALSVNQCMRYALDRPGVVTVSAGYTGMEQLEEVLAYGGASDEECDYSVISTRTPEDCAGRCVYCSHCHPCPTGLDISLINKYYDLARTGDVLAREHYLTLGKTASDCTGCGHCDSRCPFRVDQSGRMKEISQYFGR